MIPRTLGYLAEAMGGSVEGNPEAIVSSICTDSRMCGDGSLFFALTGAEMDGHQFVASALQSGAAAAVVEKDYPLQYTANLVRVENTLDALSALALSYRMMMDFPVIGITGSGGKTTTREMIALLLGSKYRVLTNKANLNTETGVPMTLAELTSQHQIAVIEVAMRGLGQIEHLCRFVLPTAGVITNIGVSHIEVLKTRDNIAAAKSELLEALPGEAWAVLPRDDDYFGFLKSKCSGPVITFGDHPESDFRAVDVTLDDNACPSFILKARGQSVKVSLSIPGLYHVQNALAAIAAATRHGISLDDAAVLIGQYKGYDKRSRIITASGGWRIIDETYNASPPATLGALQALSAMKSSGRKIAILGEMRELGDLQEKCHREVGSMVAQVNPDLLITVAGPAKWIAEQAEEDGFTGESLHFPTVLEAREYISVQVKADDLILIKGSRALEMERIVEALR